MLKLTQSLQGVIDAAVNGGLAKYQEAFFRSSNINEPEKVLLLQTLMSEQLTILEAGLASHKKLASQDLLPLHSHLVDRFATMKNSISIAKSLSNSNPNSKIVNTPLPPVPMMTNSTSSFSSQQTAVPSADLPSSPPPASAAPITTAESADDGIYSKPADLKDNMMSTSAYNYVWSSNLDHYSPPPPRPPSMRMKAYNEMTNHHHHYHHHHRDSGINVSSIGSSEDVSAPPLPPRSSCKSYL